VDVHFGAINPDALIVIHPKNVPCLTVSCIPAESATEPATEDTPAPKRRRLQGVFTRTRHSCDDCCAGTLSPPTVDVAGTARHGICPASNAFSAALGRPVWRVIVGGTSAVRPPGVAAVADGSVHHVGVITLADDAGTLPSDLPSTLCVVAAAAISSSGEATHIDVGFTPEKLVLTEPEAVKATANVNAWLKAANAGTGYVELAVSEPPPEASMVGDSGRALAAAIRRAHFCSTAI
jgi:hypothetical protein